MNDNSIKIYGLLISAGFSGRMKSFKPLLKFEGKPFVVNIADKLAEVCEKVIVVTGFKAHEILMEFEAAENNALCKKTKFVFNKNYKEGMFSSLQSGLEKCAEADWVLLHFVDQPTLPPEFYRNFVQQADNNFDWIQPAHKNRKGHPLLIGGKVVNRILSSSANGNLRDVSHERGIKKKLWECNFDQIFTDLDTPEDFQNLE